MTNFVLGWASGGSIAENSASSVPLGVLDLDSGAFPASVSAITITGPGGYVFSVDTGTFEVTVNQGFDFETAASVPLSITIAFSDSTDNGGETLSLGVTDVNEAPTLAAYLSVTTTSIPQSAAAGREVGRVTVADPDAGDTVTLSLLGADAANFVLDGLRVRLAGGVTLDHSVAATLHVTVRGTDGGSLHSDQAFIVNVLDVQSSTAGMLAVLGGNGSSVGMSVALTDDGPLFSLGGNAAVFTGGSTLTLGDGTLAFGANTDLASIQRIYHGLLGYAANGTDMMQQADFISRGGQLADIATSILTSDTFSTYVQAHSSAPDMASLSNSEYVELLYGRVLGRASDGGGLAFWSSILDSGALSRADVAIGFTDSGEAQTHFASNTEALWAVNAQAYQVRSLYDVALNREPDSGGLAFWAGLLRDGVGLGVVADFIVASAEFQSHIAGLTTTQVLQQFYLDGLERSADTNGLDYWVATVEGGLADWSDVLVGFAQSSEQEGQLAGYRNGTDIFTV